jgi:hypothetical protein
VKYRGENNLIVWVSMELNGVGMLIEVEEKMDAD